MVISICFFILFVIILLFSYVDVVTILVFTLICFCIVSKDERASRTPLEGLSLLPLPSPKPNLVGCVI